jgi:hypothetical protein
MGGMLAFSVIPLPRISDTLLMTFSAHLMTHEAAA